jgi:lipoprotein-releasing system ATP-binding protein
VENKDPVIKLQSVNKIYPGVVPTPVLFDINLNIYPGDFAVILGKSGSGKTTLLNIAGLLDSATSGRIEVEGRPVHEMDEEQRAELRRMFFGFIFQFHHLLPDFDVMENALMPCRIRGREFEEEAYTRVEEMLKMVELGEKLKSRPSQLSGGQRQRVAVVRAFANQPRVVLADEPTGSLDSKTTVQVLALMHDIMDRFGTAFVMVTHDEAMTEVANRVIELKDGRIVRDERI